MNAIKVGIVDDDQLITMLLGEFLNKEENIDVVFCNVDGYELLNTLEKDHQTIDVLLLDLKMKTIDGIKMSEIIREKYPEIKIIILSSHYQETSLSYMLKLGVAAFQPKGISPKILSNIIQVVYDTNMYLDDQQIMVLRNQISHKVLKPVIDEDNLTEREQSVLILLCHQKTAKEIGETLFITQRTVEGHKNNLFIKTGAKNVVGLILYALQREIVKIEELPMI